MIILDFIYLSQRYGWYGRDNAVLQQNFDKAVEKYEWLDDVRDRSVTEVEFLRGHLNNPGEIPAFICFRDLVSLLHMHLISYYYL